MGDQQSGDGVFEINRIRKLLELMKEFDLHELDLQADEQKIRLTRGGVVPMVAASSAMPMALSSPTNLAPPSSPASSGGDSDGPHIVIVKSPMVGTYYSKPNPNSKNFVEVGSTVQADTTVCIIEAMKVFNEIPAEVQGKVVAVLVQNEESVDFGKPLFKVDTRG